MRSSRLLRRFWFVVLELFYFENKLVGMLSMRWNNTAGVYTQSRLALVYSLFVNFALTVGLPLVIFGGIVAVQPERSVLATTYNGMQISYFFLVCVTVVAFMANRSEVLAIVNVCIAMLRQNQLDTGPYARQIALVVLMKFAILLMLLSFYWSSGVPVKPLEVVLQLGRSLMFFLTIADYYLFMLAVNCFLCNLTQHIKSAADRFGEQRKCRLKSTADMDMCEMVDESLDWYRRIATILTKCDRFYGKLLLATIGYTFVSLLLNVSRKMRVKS
jgi:hypothetical protein